MQSEVNERDWKLFRSRLPGWQEAYMEKLIREYAAMLDDDQPASEKFWALEKRIKQDRKHPGVLLADVRRSTMYMHLLSLLLNGVITAEDLEGFSGELRSQLADSQEFFERKA